MRHLTEQRRHLRVTLETDVWIGQDGVFARTTERLRNLSVGGAFLETRSGWRIGEIFSLRFALKLDYVMSTVVVRNLQQGVGMGVEFLDLSPESRSTLEAFIAAESESPSPVQAADSARFEIRSRTHQW